MLTPGLSELIDKVDTAELVRDRLAEILLVETRQQQNFARNAGKDPRLWGLRIFTEASNPWEEWLGNPEGKTPVDSTPIVNVWWNNADDDEHASNTVERQKSTATYHVDCYGYGVARENDLGGHDPGDVLAAFEAQRAARLVRNIIMAGHYTYLGLRKTVWRRWRASAQSFQPSIEGRAVQRVMGVRLAFRVEFNELSPQVQGNPLQGISIEIQRLSDGRVYLTANYPEP